MLLQRAKFLGVLSSIDVSDTSVSQQSADSASASINFEVEELAWTSDFRASVETKREDRWSVVFCSALVMGTFEVLLQVGIALHAIVESFKFRIQLEGLVAQMNGIVNMRHQRKICNTWLGAHKVLSVIIEQLTDNFKAIQGSDNRIRAVTFAFQATNEHC